MEFKQLPISDGVLSWNHTSDSDRVNILCLLSVLCALVLMFLRMDVDYKSLLDFISYLNMDFGSLFLYEIYTNVL
jgi:hypothetical protein